MLVPRGLVSFARPGGNATGINFPLAEVAVKELGLLHEVVPAARRIGLLVNPNNSPSAAVIERRDGCGLRPGDRDRRG